MFDIGFSELLLVFVIGLVVLGPERLPVAVRTIAGWVKVLRSLATTVQTELTQELKIQELQGKLKNLEALGVETLTPELKTSMDALRQATQSLRNPSLHDLEKFEPATGKVQPANQDEDATPALSQLSGDKS